MRTIISEKRLRAMLDQMLFKENHKELFLVEELLKGKQVIAAKSYSLNQSDNPDTSSLGPTAGPPNINIIGYVTEDAGLFNDVLGAIGTEGSTGFGNSLEQIFDECVAQELNMSMTPLNTDVIKGMDFADGLATDSGENNGADGGADVLSEGDTFFAISYKSSAIVDNFDGSGNVNMSKNSFQKFLQCCVKLKNSGISTDGKKIAPALLSAGIDFSATRNLDFKGLVFRCNLVIDANPSVHVTFDNTTPNNNIVKVVMPVNGLKIDPSKNSAMMQYGGKSGGSKNEINTKSLAPYIVKASDSNGNMYDLTHTLSSAESPNSFNTNFLNGLGTIYTFNLILTDNFDILSGKTGQGITSTSREIKSKLFNRILSNVNIRNMELLSQMLRKQGKTGLSNPSEITGLRQVFDPSIPSEDLPGDIARIQQTGVAGSGFTLGQERVGDPTSSGTTIGALRKLATGPSKTGSLKQFRTQDTIDAASSNEKIIRDYIETQIKELEEECEKQIDSLGQEIYATSAGAQYLAEAQAQMLIFTQNFYDKKTQKPNFGIMRIYGPRIFRNLGLYCAVSVAAYTADRLGMGNKREESQPIGSPQNNDDNRLREFRDTYLDNIDTEINLNTRSSQIELIKLEYEQITNELKTQIASLFNVIKKELRQNPDSAEFMLKSLVDHLKQLNSVNAENVSEDRRIYESVLRDILKIAKKRNRSKIRKIRSIK